MQYDITLTAGQRVIQQTAGAFFMLVSIGAAPSLDLRFVSGNTELEHLTSAPRTFKARMPQGQRFSQVELIAPVNCTVSFVISDGVLDINGMDGATVNVGNTAPIPTSNDRGSPGAPIFISGTIPGTSPAALITDDAPVAVTAAAGAVAAANTNRVSLRITNTGANPVALGSAALTWAKAAIIIQPGDTWVEERAANLAWYAICNTALTSTLGVQEVTV